MGGFVEFHRKQCRYAETEIGVGRDRNPSPYLALFRCPRCMTVGSTWVQAGQPARCANCYEENVPLLPENVTVIDCPRCGQKARFTSQDGSWV